MKRALFTLLAVVLVAGLSGCLSTRVHRVHQAGPGVRGTHKQASGISRPVRAGRAGRGVAGAEAFNPGPPVGSVTYPYYTIRGPRDFLASDPPSIGP